MISRSFLARIRSLLPSRSASSLTPTPPPTALNVLPRPLTHHQLFFSERLKALATQRPELKKTEIFKCASQEWRTLPAATKEAYKQRALEALRKYQAQIEAMTPEEKRALSKLKKNRRVVVDANAPKRPLSSYMRFCISNRSKVKESTSDVKAQAKKLSEMWKNALASEKSAFQQEYKRDYALYKSALEEYQKNNAGVRKLTYGALEKMKQRAAMKVKEAKLKAQEKTKKLLAAKKEKLVKEKVKKALAAKKELAAKKQKLAKEKIKKALAAKKEKLANEKKKAMEAKKTKKVTKKPALKKKKTTVNKKKVGSSKTAKKRVLKK